MSRAASSSSGASAAATRRLLALASAVPDSIPPPILLNEGTDFGVWKAKVIGVVKAKKWSSSFSGPPLGVVSVSASAASASVSELNRRQENLDKFYAFLVNCFDTNVETLFRDYIIAGDAEDLFNALCDHYESQDMNSKIAIQNELAVLKLAEGGDIDMHIATFKKLVSRLVALGESLAPSELITKFANTLPRSFEVAITSLTLQDGITLDGLIAKVRAYVQQVKTRRLTESAHLASAPLNELAHRTPHRAPHRVPHRDRRSPANNRRKDDSDPDDGSDDEKYDIDESKSKSKRRGRIRCFNCGRDHSSKDCKYDGKCDYCKRRGHIALLCFNRILDENEAKEKQSKERSNMVIEQIDENDYPLMLSGVSDY